MTATTDQDDRTGSILVGYDGSMGSRVALDWAIEAAKRLDASLTLLHCVTLASVPAFPGYEPVEIIDSLEGVSRSILAVGFERATKALGEGRVERINAIGSAPAQLVGSSKDADFVVMGSRGRGRVLGGVLGSTAYTVTAHAHCPVVVIRTDGDDVSVPPPLPGPDRRVILGVDGSEESYHAIESAARFAQTFGAPLHIVRVAESISMEAWAYAETARAGTESTHAVTEQAADTVEQARAHVLAAYPGVEVETEVLYGDPGRTIAELATTAGLVVIGSRGRGGFAGLLLGSVSHTIIHEAACPVMVVR